MSHFSVMVIGDDPEYQLAPFHEFECTGMNDEFVQNVDITERAMEGFKSYSSDYENLFEFAKDEYGLKAIKTGEEPDTDDPHKYGWVRVNEDGEVVEVVKRTNPNKKWDWWVEGGRFSGHLRLKNGIRTDTARKGDIDFDAMKRDRANKAAETYDKVAEAAGGQPAWESGESVRGRIKSIEQAREFYHGQPQIKALNENRDLFFMDRDQFLVPREKYIADAEAGAISTYALVENRTWYQSGEMGWWGMSSNEMDPNEWNRLVMEKLEGLPDDTIITIVDCHI